MVIGTERPGSRPTATPKPAFDPVEEIRKFDTFITPSLLAIIEKQVWLGCESESLNGLL